MWGLAGLSLRCTHSWRSATCTPTFLPRILTQTASSSARQSTYGRLHLGCTPPYRPHPLTSRHARVALLQRAQVLLA